MTFEHCIAYGGLYFGISLISLLLQQILLEVMDDDLEPAFFERNEIRLFDIPLWVIFGGLIVIWFIVILLTIISETWNKIAPKLNIVIYRRK